MTQAVESLRQHWQVAVGLAVVVLAAALVVRGVGRRRGQETPEQTRERRGKTAEDLLTVAVASIAAALSAHALTAFAQSTLGLHGAWRLLPFGALDAAAVVCALRARRRANAGQGAGINGPLVWALAAISALFSAGTAAAGRPVTAWSALGHGIWALVAATLWEIGLVEQRRSRQARPDRRVGWIRWLHPVERLRVLAELAADTAISADEATARVRQQRAARALYRLNAALAALERSQKGPMAPQGGAGRTERRLRAVERRAQRAAVRVRLADAAVADAVMPQLRVLVDVRRIAAQGGRPAPPQVGLSATADASSATTAATADASSATTATTADAPPLGHVVAQPLWPTARSQHAAVAMADGPAPAMAHPSGLASREGGSQAPAHREQHLPVSPVWEEALHPVQASGSMALERREGRVPAQQSRAEELPVGQVDERVLQIMGWLDAEPALSGAEAARRLGIPVRTGQRLRRAAEEQRQRRVTGQRRLRSVGDVGHGPAPQG